MRAPLLGHNLVRLLYLDEAGTDFRHPYLCVAGVLVHGDKEWPEIDRRIAALVDKHIPEADRLGFVFHATDMFHGSDYFDKRKPEWSDRVKRWSILDELAQIIEDMSLPVVFGRYIKGRMKDTALVDQPLDFQRSAMHDTAAMDCLIRADRWLATFAPSELATVTHEDGTAAKTMIKHTVRLLRSEQRLRAAGLDQLVADMHLPLKRIIDTVNFADKSDARPLQLADLCAFVLGRSAKNASVPDRAFDIIWKHLKWVTTYGDVIREAPFSAQGPLS